MWQPVKIPHSRYRRGHMNSVKGFHLLPVPAGWPKPILVRSSCGGDTCKHSKGSVALVPQVIAAPVVVFTRGHGPLVSTEHMGAMDCIGTGVGYFGFRANALNCNLA